MAETHLGVLAIGALCPLGVNTLQLAMCARARKLVPRRSPFTDRRGDRVGVCRAPGQGDDRIGYDRLLDLAAGAFEEATIGVATPLPIVLALPEAGLPGDDHRIGLPLLRALASRHGARLDEDRSRVVRAGHAGFAIALEAAAAILAASPGTPVLVGGADSAFHPDRIAALDEADRLHGLEADDGFIPSEGAAFALLGAAHAAARGPAPIAILADVRNDREPPGGDDDASAAAMTRALRAVAGAPGRGPIGWIINDVNGERRRVKEWDRTLLRGPFAPDLVDQRLPVDLGDLGAATGAVMLALAAAAWRAGFAPRPDVVGALHSDGGERGAFLLRAPSLEAP